MFLTVTISVLFSLLAISNCDSVHIWFQHHSHFCQNLHTKVFTPGSNIDVVYSHFIQFNSVDNQAIQTNISHLVVHRCERCFATNSHSVFASDVFLTAQLRFHCHLLYKSRANHKLGYKPCLCDVKHATDDVMNLRTNQISSRSNEPENILCRN